MTSRAALSPAWLGLFAALSFGGLVLASFASGYHLVMKTAPRSVPAEAAGKPATRAASPGADVAAEQAGKSAASEAAGSGGAAAKAPVATDPAEAIVRPNLRPDRARVRSQPETGVVVARLPSNQRVTLRGRSGEWLHIEFDRKGKHVDGWTQETNLQLR
jgi:hypothetical protein